MSQPAIESGTARDDSASIRRLVDMALGQQVAAIVTVTAQMGLADRLAAGAKSSATLAEELGADASSLLRFLRACASLELLEQVGPDRFALGPLGTYLRSEGDSIRGFAMGMSSPVAVRSWERLREGVIAGKAVLRDVLGMDFWDWVFQNPDELVVLQDQWREMSLVTASAVVQHYDLTGFHRIVDVGCNLGFSIPTLMRAAPNAHFVLIDQPMMVALAEELLADAGVVERVEFVGGDFFEEVPPGGDLYLLKGVLLDLTDDQVVRVFESCHRAAPSGSRLVVLDGLIPLDRPGPPTVHITDLHMMLTLGGRYRTRGDFEQLLGKAGYSLERVIPAPMPQGLYHIFEAQRQ